MMVSKILKNVLSAGCAVCMALSLIAGTVAGTGRVMKADAADNSTVTLRVCNWEEYIDESMVDEFEEWYEQAYGSKVKVLYSTIGTNEELYNMLTLGDEYDLVCPSEYMIMKLMAEGWLEPFSDEFHNASGRYNYYAKGVSPFISEVFDNNKINGESWSKYAAGYMWGITGIVYNPEYVSEEEASTWTIINNPKFKRQITIKDNVRDSMFAAVGAVKADILTDKAFINSSDYSKKLAEEMNDTSEETVEKVLEYLQEAKDNVYSFETDSAKADMITQKVKASYQWSGDAVYTMDQAEEDDVELAFAVPEESTNMYFDGWVMLKSGVSGNSDKKQAAEAFVNFLSIPENAVRNMDYIGYTSVISGGDSDAVYDYVKECYEADDDDTDTVEYPLGYFFSGDSSDERYMLTASVEQTKRQLSAQYPLETTMERSAVMQYFDNDANTRINQMWINVRCYNISNMPMAVRILIGIAITLIVGGYIYKKIRGHIEN